MNHQKLLNGCHSVCEVATAYYPCELTTSSTRIFRKQVKLYPRLYAILLESGYTDHISMLVPVQIAAVIREWGMPGEAYSAMEERSKEKRT